MDTSFTRRYRIYDMSSLRFRKAVSDDGLVTIDVMSANGMVLGTAVGTEDEMERHLLVDAALEDALQAAWVLDDQGDLVKIALYNPLSGAVETSEIGEDGLRRVFRFSDPVPISRGGVMCSVADEMLVLATGEVARYRKATVLNIMEELLAHRGASARSR